MESDSPGLAILLSLITRRARPFPTLLSLRPAVLGLCGQHPDTLFCKDTEDFFSRAEPQTYG